MSTPRATDGARISWARTATAAAVEFSAWTATPVNTFLGCTLPAAVEFSEAVAVFASKLLRRVLRALAGPREHAPRRWTLPVFEPLELARAIHAPPAWGRFGDSAVDRRTPCGRPV